MFEAHPRFEQNHLTPLKAATDFAVDFTVFSKPFIATFPKRFLQFLVPTFKIPILNDVGTPTD